MVKIADLEDRIARIEQILIKVQLMADPNAIIETQLPRVEDDPHFEAQKHIEEEIEQPETQYPRRE